MVIIVLAISTVWTDLMFRMAGAMCAWKRDFSRKFNNNFLYHLIWYLVLEDRNTPRQCWFVKCSRCSHRDKQTTTKIPVTSARERESQLDRGRIFLLKCNGRNTLAQKWISLWRSIQVSKYYCRAVVCCQNEKSCSGLSFVHVSIFWNCTGTVFIRLNSF